MGKLIVGLGNPGEQYKNNRHNIGFKIIDAFAKKNKILLDKKQFNGEFGVFILNGEKVVIAKPLTYMNLSGEFVKSFIDYYGLSIDDLYIIYDDVDTNIGSFRLKTTGSSGGQNGMKNIIEKLGTENIKRIRIGVGPRNKKVPLANFVLSNFTQDELTKISKVINNVCVICQNINLYEFSDLEKKSLSGKGS